MTDPLSRLRAGLDRDEAIARAIDDKQADSGWGIETYSGDPGQWISPHIGRVHESEAAEHIVRFGPDRALCQSEVFRKLLQLQADAERDSALSDRDAGFEAGLSAALDLLASIYPEDTETGDGE